MNDSLRDTFQKIFISKYVFHLSVAATSFLIIFSRRPDAILNAQFWAEDGVVWYAQAYQNGIFSLFVPELGYYGTDARVVANLAQMLPLAIVPLFFNLFSFACKIAVVQFFISERFSKIVESLPVRLLIAFIYLAIPNAFELDGNLTNAHWHLALLSFLIIIAEPSGKILWKIFDAIILLISVLSSPFCFFLLPVACLYWWRRRQNWTLWLIAIILFGCLGQGVSLLMNSRLPQTTLGANFGLLTKIIGGQIFIGAIFGQWGYVWLIVHILRTSWVTAAACFFGVAFLIYALIKVPLELKLFIIYAALALTASLIAPAASPDKPQWEILALPGAGARYWFFPMLCFLVTLVYFATTSNKLLLKSAASILLILSLCGIIKDWKQPPLKDLNFPEYVKEFEAVPAGTEVAIPINPSWEMKLVKK